MVEMARAKRAKRAKTIPSPKLGEYAFARGCVCPQGGQERFHNSLAPLCLAVAAATAAAVVGNILKSIV